MCCQWVQVNMPVAKSSHEEDKKRISLINLCGKRKNLWGQVALSTAVRRWNKAISIQKEKEKRGGPLAFWQRTGELICSLQDIIEFLDQCVIEAQSNSLNWLKRQESMDSVHHSRGSPELCLMCIIFCFSPICSPSRNGWKLLNLSSSMPIICPPSMPIIL